MSDQEPLPPHEVFTEAHATDIAALKQKPTLFQRATKSMPILITVIVHVVLFLIAGALVVQEQYLDKNKTKFAPPPPSESSAPQQEHRLQVARKGGATGGSSSPVSANRIYASAEGALQLPDMPSLPSMGQGGFGGFSGLGTGVGIGAGSSMNTSLGGGGLGGTGFMSLSFLGITSQNVQKIALVIDVGANVMDIKKGGYESFEIMREEMQRLVAQLPPSAEFGIVLFESNAWSNNSFRVFKPDLAPGTIVNKDEFLKWIQPINKDYQNIGVQSTNNATPWTPTDLPTTNGRVLRAPNWVDGVQAALQMKAETIYVITAGMGSVAWVMTDEQMAKEEKERLAKREAIRRSGVDIEAVEKAWDDTRAKAKADIEAINKKLVAAGKPPFIYSSIDRVYAADFIAAVRKSGHAFNPSKAGWTDASGRPIDTARWPPNGRDPTTYAELPLHISRLRNEYVPGANIKLNIFYFLGPDQDAKKEVEALSPLARRNGGTFQLIDVNKLKQFKAKADAESK